MISPIRNKDYTDAREAVIPARIVAGMTYYCLGNLTLGNPL